MIMQATSDTRIYSSKRLSVLFVEIIILHLYAVTTTSELECSAHAELMNHTISKKQNAKPITWLFDVKETQSPKFVQFVVFHGTKTSHGVLIGVWSIIRISADAIL